MIVKQRGENFTIINIEPDAGPQTQHLYYKLTSFSIGHTLHPGSYCGPWMPTLGQR